MPRPPAGPGSAAEVDDPPVWIWQSTRKHWRWREHGIDDARRAWRWKIGPARPALVIGGARPVRVSATVWTCRNESVDDLVELLLQCAQALGGPLVLLVHPFQSLSDRRSPRRRILSHCQVVSFHLPTSSSALSFSVERLRIAGEARCELEAEGFTADG